MDPEQGRRNEQGQERGPQGQPEGQPEGGEQQALVIADVPG